MTTIGDPAPDIDLVLVDFDDTLVETAPRFERARRDLFERLASSGFEIGEVERVHHHDVDPVMRRAHGLGPHRLPMAFTETYRALCLACGREVDEAEAEACGRLAAAVVGTPPVIAGAIPALRRLAGRLPTAIYTQAADAAYQTGCVREAGVFEVVGEARVRVVPWKTAEALQDTLEHFDVVDPSRARMVGNSIRSDINPALELGVPAILVEVDAPWQHDVVEPLHNGFPVVRTFREAVDLILGE
jgi:putative hydrolase of the HAD superfamily